VQQLRARLDRIDRLWPEVRALAASRGQLGAIGRVEGKLGRIRQELEADEPTTKERLARLRDVFPVRGAPTPMELGPTLRTLRLGDEIESR
jgi:hypothetical protein